MADVKSTNSPVAAGSATNKSGNTMLLNFIVVAICIAVGILIFQFVMGSPSNFTDPSKEQSKNLLGTMYHGGFLVPVLMATFLTWLCFFVERLISVFRSRGSMSNAEFTRKVNVHLNNGNIDAAIAECDKQKGSVGNVMRAGLKKYKEMSTTTGMDQEQKLAVIQKEVEEATALEMPMLERNLVFLSTISSVATLIGLLGTVSGMIKSFQAMGQSGAPDSNKLAQGISEALINTALGIGTSLFAIISYNFFTTIIDNITHGIDESGFTLSQSFKAKFPH